MIAAMNRSATALEPTPSSEPQTREPSPGEAAEQIAARVKQDAQRDAAGYLRETVVPEGGE